MSGPEAEWQVVALNDETNLAEMARTLSQLAQISRPIVIDARGLRHPDATVLLALTGWTSERARLMQPTKFRLPANPAGRELLRRMNFEYGFVSAVGERLDCYVLEADKEYFEPGGRLASAGAFFPNDLMLTEAGAALQERGYFQFRSWDGEHVHPRINMPALRNELSSQELRWSDELLVSLLSRRLGRENAGYVGSHIIYEALSNAFRHANSQRIVSVEQVYDAPKLGDRAVLRIAFWDNGEPVQDTLRTAIRAGRRVIHSDGAAIEVHFYRPDGTVFNLAVAEAALNSDHADRIAGRDLFLSAFLPGITSEHDGFGAVYHQLLTKKYPLLAAPGKGLFNMLNATCTFFGGTLTAWSGGQAASFSNYKGASSTGTSKTAYPFAVVTENLPSNEYRGNFIAIELPLQT